MFLTFVSAFVISSCGSGEDKKEVIVVPASTQRVIIEEKEPAKKSTTVTLDKNGVKVEGKKVEVVIKKN